MAVQGGGPELGSCRVGRAGRCSRNRRRSPLLYSIRRGLRYVNTEEGHSRTLQLCPLLMGTCTSGSTVSRFPLSSLMVLRSSPWKGAHFASRTSPSWGSSVSCINLFQNTYREWPLLLRGRRSAGGTSDK